MIKNTLILAQISQGRPGLHSGDLLPTCLLIDLEDSGRFVKQVLQLKKPSLDSF